MTKFQSKSQNILVWVKSPNSLSDPNPGFYTGTSALKMLITATQIIKNLAYQG